jgi:hypothetical protein
MPKHILRCPASSIAAAQAGKLSAVRDQAKGCLFLVRLKKRASIATEPRKFVAENLTECQPQTWHFELKPEQY